MSIAHTRIGDWIERHPGMPVMVVAGATLDALIDRVVTQHCRDIYIADDDGRIAGHISHARLARILLAEHRPMHSRRQLVERVAGGSAADLMDTHFVQAHPEESLDVAIYRQLDHDIEDMPVIDDDGVVRGTINLTEVLRAVRAEQRQSAGEQK